MSDEQKIVVTQEQLEALVGAAVSKAMRAPVTTAKETAEERSARLKGIRERVAARKVPGDDYSRAQAVLAHHGILHVVSVLLAETPDTLSAFEQEAQLTREVAALPYGDRVAVEGRAQVAEDI